MKNFIIPIVLWFMFVGYAQADELVHKFKSPSFSGIGTSSHYLTIENQEKTRKDAIKDDIEAALLAAQRAEENTTLAKFMRNLESRIYSQFAKQLVDSMFSNDGAATFGSFTLEGSIVTWELVPGVEGTPDFIRLTVVDEFGSETVIEIPVGTGFFSQDSDGTGDGDG